MPGSPKKKMMTGLAGVSSSAGAVGLSTLAFLYGGGGDKKRPQPPGQPRASAPNSPATPAKLMADHVVRKGTGTGKRKAKREVVVEVEVESEEEEEEEEEVKGSPTYLEDNEEDDESVGEGSEDEDFLMDER